MATENELSGQPGRDHVFDITIKNKDGEAMDLTDLDGFAVVAFAEENALIYRWCEPKKDGWGEVGDTDFATGKIKLHLPKEKTKELSNEQVYIEVVTQINDEEYGAMQYGMKDGEKQKLIYLTTVAEEEPGNLQQSESSS